MYEILFVFTPGLTDEQHDRVIDIVDAHNSSVGGGGDDDRYELVLSSDSIMDIVGVINQVLEAAARGLLPNVHVDEVPEEPQDEQTAGQPA